jgi:hypothetical protein
VVSPESTPDGPTVDPVSGFDEIAARLAQLRGSFGGEGADTRPDTAVPTPAAASEPARTPRPPRGPGPVARLARRMVELSPTVRERLSPRALAVAGGGLAAVLLGVALVAVLGRTSSGTDDAGGAGPDSGQHASANLRFPETTADASTLFPEEPRLRPVGVRILEVGLEGPVAGVSELPSCPRELEPADRVRWFDPGPDAAGSTGAVAPGQNGVAVLVAGSDFTRGDALFAGIEQVVVGQLVEVARSNGTVLAWTVIAVADLAVGTPFPAGLLDPAAEQRLVLLGCAASFDGEAQDRYVLARRSG